MAMVPNFDLTLHIQLVFLCLCDWTCWIAEKWLIFCKNTLVEHSWDGDFSFYRRNLVLLSTQFKSKNLHFFLWKLYKRQTFRFQQLTCMGNLHHSEGSRSHRECSIQPDPTCYFRVKVSKVTLHVQPIDVFGHFGPRSFFTKVDGKVDCVLDKKVLL